MLHLKNRNDHDEMMKTIDGYYDIDSFLDLLIFYKKIFKKYFVEKTIQQNSNEKRERDITFQEILYYYATGTRSVYKGFKRKLKYIDMAGYYYIWYAINNRELKLYVDDDVNMFITKLKIRRINRILNEFIDGDNVLYTKVIKDKNHDCVEYEVILKSVPYDMKGMPIISSGTINADKHHVEYISYGDNFYKLVEPLFLK